MAPELFLDISSTGEASTQPLNGLPVQRDDDASSLRRKSRLLNTELPATATSSVDQAQIADFRRRLLAVFAPPPFTHWPGSDLQAKYLENLHEAHEKLDNICQELLKASSKVFYDKARISATQLSVYAPRRQEIEAYRKQILGIEVAPDGPVPFAAQKAEEETLSPSQQDAIERWKALKTKLQSAVAAVEMKADQRRRQNRKSVRFSGVTDVREYEVESDGPIIDSEDLAFVDSGIDFGEASASKLFTSNDNGDVEVNGKSRRSSKTTSEFDTVDLASFGFDDIAKTMSERFSDNSIPSELFGYGNGNPSVDLVVSLAPANGEEDIELPAWPASPTNGTIDPRLLQRKPPPRLPLPLPPVAPTHTKLKPYTFPPRLSPPTGASPSPLTKGPGYPTPPPSSPLPPVPISQAPLKSILVRKARKFQIYPDTEHHPPKKQKKLTPTSLTRRPVTPPSQHIELQAPPRRPVKKPSPELEYDNDMVSVTDALMKQLTKNAKAGKDGKIRQTFSIGKGAMEGDGDKRTSFNDSGFFDESRMSLSAAAAAAEPFDDDVWGAMTGSP